MIAAAGSQLSGYMQYFWSGFHLPESSGPVELQSSAFNKKWKYK